jgi:hypothetical protein
MIVFTALVLAMCACAAAQTKDDVKIYVYTELDSPYVAALTDCGEDLERHAEGQWGMEVSLHKWFSSAAVRTADPAQATFFFIPSYAKCLDDFKHQTITGLNVLFSNLVEDLPWFKCGAHPLSTKRFLQYDLWSD